MSPPALSALASSLLDVALPAACAGLLGRGSDALPDLPSSCGRAAGPAIGRPYRVALGFARATSPAGVVRTVHRHREGGATSTQVLRRAAPGQPLGAALAARWLGPGQAGSCWCRCPSCGAGQRPATISRCCWRQWPRYSLAHPGWRRSKDTPDGAAIRSGRRARRTNVTGAFAIRGPSQAARIEGRWVVLVTMS